MDKNSRLTKNTYRIFIVASFICLGLGLGSVQAQTGIEGKWKDTEKGITLLIFQENGKYFGQVVASDDPKQNEKIQAHGKKIVVLKNLEKKSDSKYCCGTIYQPEKGKTLSATLTLKDKNTLQLKAKYGLISGTRIWKRI